MRSNINSVVGCGGQKLDEKYDHIGQPKGLAILYYDSGSGTQLPPPPTSKPFTYTESKLCQNVRSKRCFISVLRVFRNGCLIFYRTTWALQFLNTWSLQRPPRWHTILKSLESSTPQVILYGWWTARASGGTTMILSFLMHKNSMHLGTRAIEPMRPTSMWWTWAKIPLCALWFIIPPLLIMYVQIYTGFRGKCANNKQPIHLHGHNMQVLHEGAGPWDRKSLINVNNPQRRDVQQLPILGHIVVQFDLDNPGVWPFHCHNAWWAILNCPRCPAITTYILMFYQ